MTKKKADNVKNCKYCGKSFVTRKNRQYCSKNCAATWRRLYGYRYIPKNTVSNTLCWICKNATTDGCDWSKEFKPVEGWTANQTVLNMGIGRAVISYEVVECPLFERG